MEHTPTSRYTHRNCRNFLVPDALVKKLAENPKGLSVEELMQLAGKDNTAAMRELSYRCQNGIDGMAKDEAAAESWAAKSAALGDWSAQTDLALYYVQAKETADGAKALRFATPAAEAGDLRALGVQARIYIKGLGVPVDYEKAFELIQSVEENERTAELHKMFGSCYMSGPDGMFDPALGLRYIQRAAEMDDAEACYILSVWHDSGTRSFADKELARRWCQFGMDALHNPKEANHWLRRAAELGHSKAQYDWGMELMARNGKQGHRRAIGWFRKAAEQEQTNAKYMLGMALLTAGTPDEEAEGIRILRELAVKGDSESLETLASAYLKGIGVPRNPEAAIRLYTLAANAGDKRACFSLALLYRRGEDVPRDTDAAMKWLKKSVELGYGQAKAVLGSLYLGGRGVEQDTEKGLAILHEAAAEGVPLAQFTLGECYADGHFVQQDLTRAAELLTQALHSMNSLICYGVGCRLIRGQGLPKT